MCEQLCKSELPPAEPAKLKPYALRLMLRQVFLGDEDVAVWAGDGLRATHPLMVIEFGPREMHLAEGTCHTTAFELMIR